MASQAASISLAPSTGFAAVSRTVVSAAAELVTGLQRAVMGPAGVRTARDNAWAALQADRARHEARDQLTREVAAILATNRKQPAKTF